MPEIVCMGSIRLGTGCEQCVKCAEELAAYFPGKTFDEVRAERLKT